MLKLLPAYTGAVALEEVLLNPRAMRILWLEILINDRVDVSPYWDRADVRDAYQKACRWYTAYRTLIHSLLSREPLPVDPTPIDAREYRTFAEALRFVADHD
ncbi:MAG TPA: hypothetical protein VJ692_07035 [Nitrospiraceae bacterium]|nr:hypothetical protein [Nitrospiraceae bacterium]